MRVDVHAHHLPERYMEMLKEGNGPCFGRPHNAETLQAMVRGQDAAGIDIQVLSTGPNSPYLADPALAVAAAREVNDRYQDVVANSAGRFAAFGAVPLPHPELAAAEAVRCLDELNFAGIHLGCSAMGKPLDHPDFAEMWLELDRRDAIVFVHPGGIALGSEPGLAGMDDLIIAVSIGSAAELATAALRLTRLCRTHRKVRPIIALLGGALPFLVARVGMGIGKLPIPSFLDGLSDYEELVAELRRFHYEINLLPDPEAIRSAIRVFGFDRLLFGSDAPAGSPQRAVDFMGEAGLSDLAIQAVVSEHPAKLFGTKMGVRHGSIAPNPTGI